MLELKDIKKYYTVGASTTKALDGVSVAFRKQEFVAILWAKRLWENNHVERDRRLR